MQSLQPQSAVPYLRSADLRLEDGPADGRNSDADSPDADSPDANSHPEEDRLIAGVRAIYRQVIAAIDARRESAAKATEATPPAPGA